VTSSRPLRFLAVSPAEKATTNNLLTLDQVQSWTGQIVASTEANNDASEGVVFREGDVLFSKLRPYLAKSIRPKHDGVASTEFLVLRPSDHQFDARFLHYYTLSEPFVAWAVATSYGTKMPRSNWDSIGRFEVLTPRLEVQRRIADMLDTETARIDTIIDKCDRLIELLTRRLESLRAELLWPSQCTNLWSGDPLSAPTSSVREMTRLQYVVPTRVAGGTPTSNSEIYWTDSPDVGVAWYSIGDMRHGSLSGGPSRWVSSAGMEAAGLTVMSAGTVVYAMYASIGKTSILQSDGVTNQAILSLVPCDDLLSEYLFEWLVFTQPFAEARARANTQGNLNADQVARFCIRIPTIERQRAIVDELAVASAKVETMHDIIVRQQELLRLRRRALITAAVTGQIDA